MDDATWPSAPSHTHKLELLESCANLFPSSLITVALDAGFGGDWSVVGMGKEDQQVREDFQECGQPALPREFPAENCFWWVSNGHGARKGSSAGSSVGTASQLNLHTEDADESAGGHRKMVTEKMVKYHVFKA